MQNNNIPRMRTIEEAYNEIKSLDPNTAISKNFIRTLTVSGKIPVSKAGRKNLINMDILENYLCNECSINNDSGTIRPISTKIDYSNYRKAGVANV
ncbi:MAG: hypothetical protein IJ168_05580 [Eubacterium sp.]|nr:hypothetical protein [Eubacterium sp.]